MVFGQGVLQIGQGQPGLHGDGEVIHGVVDDPVESAGAHGWACLLKRRPPVQATSQPCRRPGTATAMQVAHQRAELSFAVRLQQRLGEGLSDGGTERAR